MTLNKNSFGLDRKEISNGLRYEHLLMMMTDFIKTLLNHNLEFELIKSL